MRQFAQLFAGRTDCYGTYVVREKRDDGKQKGKGTTHEKPLTEEVWAAHLSGKRMLGVVPIRTDGTVCWFAGDIDVYTIDLAKLNKVCQDKNIPVVLCRSKSGGAHLYCFVDGAIPAATGIKLMRKWLAMLGHPRCEVFPKQEHIAEGATGNWINLPYFGGDLTDRWAFGLGGEKLKLGEFEQLASARSIRPSDVPELLAEEKASKSPYADAPPCIEKMSAEGVHEGGRNRAAFHWAVYFYKSDPDNWRDKLAAANYQIFDPPLTHEEITQVMKNVGGGKYQYLCKEEPMCSICDKDACLTRKWGVGPQQGISYAEVVIDRLIKIASDPPIFYLVCNGKSVKMATEQLLSNEKCRRRIYEMIGMLMPKLPAPKWEEFIQKLPVDVQEAPDEVSLDGQVLESFREWAFNMCPKTKDVDDVARGFPFYNPETQRIIFRGTDFISMFKRTRRKEASDRDIWAALNDIGCYRDNVRVKSKQTKCWLFPVDEPWFDIPGSEKF
jgi:hypothetical protein